MNLQTAIIYYTDDPKIVVVDGFDISWAIDIVGNQITLYSKLSGGDPPTISAYSTLKEALDATKNVTQ